MSDKPEKHGRLSVFKTYKLYVGGKFPRSESGRVYEVTASSAADAAGKGDWLANAPLASRKDARDAVVAARKAFGGWSGATAYNRGQVLYRVAEMLEGRREQYVREVAEAEGLSKARAADQVDAAIDRWVWYAGWTDKIAQVVGGGNPVAGPFFNLSSPEPTGVVAVLAPQESSFLGLVSVLAPVIATGNTAVVIASERSPSRRSPSARCWPPPTCPAVSSTSCPAARRRSPRRSPRTGTSTRSTWPARTRRWRRNWRSRRPTTSSASCVHSLWTTGRPCPASSV